jgi:hypothetical protein
MESIIMKPSSTSILVVTALLIAGVFLAGCTQDSGATTGSTAAGSDQVQTVATTAKVNNVQPSGTPPADMQVNGTHPSGTPPAGMETNKTRPSGTPPADMANGSTPPSGTPPADMGNGGTPPSGTPPSGTPPSDAQASK